MKMLFSIMSYLQTHYHFKKYDFQKVDQLTGGKWHRLAAQVSVNVSSGNGCCLMATSHFIT